MSLISKNLEVPEAVSIHSHTLALARARLTRVTLPVKIIRRVAVALEVETLLLIHRTMRKGCVVIGNVVEEVNVAAVEHETGGKGVHGCVTPSLVVEAAIAVEGFKEVGIGRGPQPLETTDFKVGPLEDLVGVVVRRAVRDNIQSDSGYR